MLDLINQNYRGINGVKEIDSGIKGPVVGISVCTHGGEHAGLKTVNYLYENLDLQNNLIRGKIYFILTNIEAYKKSLEQGNENPVKYRFIDENLNRCCSIENLQESTSYEARRALELEKVLKELDYNLDIHSTYSPSEAMLISSKKAEELTNIFNVDTIYSGIPEVQVGKPFIDITERNGGIGVGLEAGWELDNSGFKIGVENSLRLLDSLGMIDLEKFKNDLGTKRKNEKLKVYDSIINQEGLKILKDFKHKDFIKKGEIIAIYNGKEIKAKKDSYILMPNKKSIGEEYCFLAEKVD